MLDTIPYKSNIYTCKEEGKRSLPEEMTMENRELKQMILDAMNEAGFSEKRMSIKKKDAYVEALMNQYRGQFDAYRKVLDMMGAKISMNWDTNRFELDED